MVVIGLTPNAVDATTVGHTSRSKCQSQIENGFVVVSICQSSVAENGTATCAIEFHEQDHSDHARQRGPTIGSRCVGIDACQTSRTRNSVESTVRCISTPTSKRGFIRRERGKTAARRSVDSTASRSSHLNDHPRKAMRKSVSIFHRTRAN
jgi:hypothetical protein